MLQRATMRQSRWFSLTLGATALLSVPTQPTVEVVAASPSSQSICSKATSCRFVIPAVDEKLHTAASVAFVKPPNHQGEFILFHVAVGAQRQHGFHSRGCQGFNFSFSFFIYTHAASDYLHNKSWCQSLHNSAWCEISPTACLNCNNHLLIVSFKQTQLRRLAITLLIATMRQLESSSLSADILNIQRTAEGEELLPSTRQESLWARRWIRGLHFEHAKFLHTNGINFIRAQRSAVA